MEKFAGQAAVHQAAFREQQQEEAATTAARVGVDSVFGEREDQGRIGDPQFDPDASLALCNEVNGHEISWNAEHPPPQDASEEEVAAWEQCVIADIRRYVHVSTEHVAACKEAVDRRVSATATLCACASCGTRGVGTDYIERDVSELHSAFMLTSAQEQWRNRLGEITLLPEPGKAPRDRVDLRELVSAYGTERERYHLHAQLVNEADPQRPKVKLCGFCAKDPQKDQDGNFRVSNKFSLARGVDFGNLDILGLPEPSALERLVLSDVRMYANVKKVVAPSNNKHKDWQHAKLTGHSIAFLHSGPGEAAKFLEFSERIDDVLRKVCTSSTHAHTSPALSCPAPPDPRNEWRSATSELHGPTP